MPARRRSSACAITKCVRVTPRSLRSVNDILTSDFSSAPAAMSSQRSAAGLTSHWYSSTPKPGSMRRIPRRPCTRRRTGDDRSHVRTHRHPRFVPAFGSGKRKKTATAPSQSTAVCCRGNCCENAPVPAFPPIVDARFSSTIRDTRIRRWENVAEALEDPDFLSIFRTIQRGISAGKGRASAGRPGDRASAGKGSLLRRRRIAAALLGTTLEELDRLFGPFR